MRNFLIILIIVHNVECVMYYNKHLQNSILYLKYCDLPYGDIKNRKLHVCNVTKCSLGVHGADT